MVSNSSTMKWKLHKRQNLLLSSSIIKDPGPNFKELLKKQTILLNRCLLSRMSRISVANCTWGMVLWLVTYSSKHNFVVLSYLLCLSSSMKLDPGLWLMSVKISYHINALLIKRVPLQRWWIVGKNSRLITPEKWMNMVRVLTWNESTFIVMS